MPHLNPIERKDNFHKHSFFTGEFSDGTKIDERVNTWTDISETKIVNSVEGEKKVHVSKFPMKHLKMEHKGISKDLDIPDDCEVYQSIRVTDTFLQNGEKKQKVLGRVFGLVKDNTVVEEYFLGDEITGYKI